MSIWLSSWWFMAVVLQSYMSHGFKYFQNQAAAQLLDTNLAAFATVGRNWRVQAWLRVLTCRYVQHSMETHRNTAGRASISRHNQTEPSRHTKNCQSLGKIRKNKGLRSCEYKCGVKIIRFSTKWELLDSALNCVYYFSQWMGRSLVTT